MCDFARHFINKREVCMNLLPRNPAQNPVSTHGWYFVDNRNFPPAITPFLIPRLNRLWQRLESTELRVLFQPIVDMNTLLVTGYEGLIRGPDDSEHFLPVGLFALARELDLAVEFEMLCSQLVAQRFIEHGLAGDLFVNVSARSLMALMRKDGLAAAFVDGLAIDPKRVTLELTEQQHVSGQLRNLKDTAAAVRALGMRLALDNFGAEFSDYLRWGELKPDCIKLDHSRVDGVAQSAAKAQFVQLVVDTRERVGTDIIAACLETGEDRDALLKMGITHGQGFWLAPPMDFSDLESPGREPGAEQ
jgi:EAL domain-containing protein (putative c-di-GMP-specific phosphodiesterase class I)